MAYKACHLDNRGAPSAVQQNLAICHGRLAKAFALLDKNEARCHLATAWMSPQERALATQRQQLRKHALHSSRHK